MFNRLLCQNKIWIGGGCDTHGPLDDQMVHGSGSGPMGDLMDGGPMRSGPCLTHHPNATKWREIDYGGIYRLNRYVVETYKSH